MLLFMQYLTDFLKSTSRSTKRNTNLISHKLSFSDSFSRIKKLLPIHGKVKAIKAATQPTTARSEASWRCQHIAQNSFPTSMSQPLQDLTKIVCSNGSFQWLEKHDQAFNHIKELLTNASHDIFQSELITDASPWGLLSRCRKVLDRIIAELSLMLFLMLSVAIPRARSVSYSLGC